MLIDIVNDFVFGIVGGGDMIDVGFFIDLIFEFFGLYFVILLNILVDGILKELMLNSIVLLFGNLNELLIDVVDLFYFLKLDLSNEFLIIEFVGFVLLVRFLLDI